MSDAMHLITCSPWISSTFHTALSRACPVHSPPCRANSFTYLHGGSPSILVFPQHKTGIERRDAQCIYFLPPQVFIHSCPTHEDRLFQSYPVWKTYRNIWDAHHVDVLPVRSPTAKKLQLAGSKVKEQQEKKVHVPKDMFCQA